MPAHRYLCVYTYVPQGLSCSLTAGGELVGKRSTVFTSGFCRAFAPPAMKHMVLLSGRLSVILCTFLKQDQREPPSWMPVHRSCIHLNQCTDVLLSWETCLLSCNHGLSDSRQMKKSIPSFLHVQPFLYRQLSRVFQYSGCMHLALLNQEKVPCFANTA